MKHMAAILAGGASSRFGSDKALSELNGEPLIAHIARVLRAEASALAVIGHKTAADAIGALSLCDPAHAPAGPLAGVLAGLDWAERCGASWLVTAPCDTPLLPADLPSRLLDAARQAGTVGAFAVTARGPHPLCAAWSIGAGVRLRAAFVEASHPSVREMQSDATPVPFEDEGAFLNINTQADRQLALARLG
jgi:molybdopterin-guanine dinucleotide biosynthesis protein A